MTDSLPLTALRVPERHAPTAGALDLRVPAVRTWIRALPLANVGETARRLFYALSEANRQEAAPAKRLAALELLQEPLVLADRALDRHVVGRTFPLSDKQRRIADLARVLQTEMADGYKIVVLDLLREEQPDRHLLATAVRHAQDHLAGILLKSWLVYAPVPDGVWRELHILYRAAERYGILEMQVSAPGPQRRAATVADGYLRTLLLGASCLYRLRQGEQIRLARLLEDWAPAVRLLPLKDAPAPDADLLVVDLDADAPPAYLRHLQPRDPATCRVLDTRGLTTYVREALARPARQTHDVLKGEHPDPDTLRRLVPVWDLVSRRSFRRSAQSGEVLVIIGLYALHRTLCKAAGSTSEHGACARLLKEDLDAPRARFTSKNLPQHDGDLPDVWDMVYEQVDPQRGPAAVTVLLSPSDGELDRTAQEWRMKNISAGGCCLLWGHEGPGRAQVGELIGIRQGAGATHRWHVGVIRRMMADGAKGLEIGVQLIAPWAVPAALRGAAHGRERAVHRRTLHLPGIDALQQPPSLITEPHTHRAGDTLTLVTADDERHIRLTQQVEDTGLFAQFQFDEAKSPDSGGGRDPQAFDSLWSVL